MKSLEKQLEETEELFELYDMQYVEGLRNPDTAIDTYGDYFSDIWEEQERNLSREEKKQEIEWHYEPELERLSQEIIDLKYAIEEEAQ